MKISIFVIFFLVSLNTYSAGSKTSGAQASSAAMSFACLDYKPVGVCFWLRCGWGCRVKTSLKIRHYVPDLMVQVYTDTLDPPIQESSSILGSILSKVGAVNNTEKYEGTYTTKKQKAADAFGHPLSLIFSSRSGYTCKGAARSYYPYFMSSLDFVAWRLSIPEFAYPQSWNVFNNLSAGSDTWGNLYPRNGSVIQPDSYKASAVIAQRVGDIITRSGQPHIYSQLRANRQEGWWPPGELKPKDEETGKWQMILPKVSNTCAVFPNSDDINQDMRSEHGAYAWNLWRPYKCCKRRGQKFLYDVEWQ